MLSGNVVKIGSPKKFFGVSKQWKYFGLYVDQRGRAERGHLLRQLLHRRVAHPLREKAVQPDRVRRRRITVLAELRDRLAVDGEAERLAERGQAVRVLRRVEDERDRVRLRRVER